MDSETIKIKQETPRHRLTHDIDWHMSLTGGKANERGSEGTRERDMTGWGNVERHTGRGDKASRQDNMETKHSPKRKPKYYTQRNHKTPLIPKGWLKWPKSLEISWFRSWPIDRCISNCKFLYNHVTLTRIFNKDRHNHCLDYYRYVKASEQNRLFPTEKEKKYKVHCVTAFHVCLS